MAQSPNRPGSGPKPGGGRRRTPPPPVKKPFPWGVVAISAVLGLLLAGILYYAVTNQGSGFVTALSRADKGIDELEVTKNPKRDHVPGTVKYDKVPPVGGPHNNTPQTCQVYTQPIASENAVHSLEHGAAWVTYRPDLPAEQVATLAGLVQGNQYRMLSPFPDLKSPISLQAWGRQVQVDRASDPRVEEFLEAYSSGPQAPERGAVCQGTTSTGPLQAAPPAAITPPAPSGAPSAAPSPTR